MISDTSATDRAIAPEPGQTGRRRLWLVAGGAATLLLLFWLLATWFGSARSVNAERLRFGEVTRGTLVRDASVNGRVVAAISPSLYAPAAGTVALKINAGDTVKKGEVLAVLASPEVDNELQRERATLQQLSAEVARQRILASKARLLAQREADSADLTRLAALRDLQRAQRGYDLGAIPEVELLRAKDALRSAEIRATHAASASGLETQDVTLALQTQQQQLERQKLVVANLERRVDELNIRAPVDGIVGTLSVADRAVVAANTALMTVVDLSRLEVELEVPETYADDLGLGMAAEVRIGNEAAVGRISAVSPEVVQNRVLARVRFDAAQPAGLRQNQRISARVLFEEKTGVLMLPRGPFFEAQGGRYAYVLDDGIAVRRPVRLGASSVASIEVLEGLQAGERVVISGTETFGDAERVAINE